MVIEQAAEAPRPVGVMPGLAGVGCAVADDLAEHHGRIEPADLRLNRARPDAKSMVMKMNGTNVLVVLGSCMARL